MRKIHALALGVALSGQLALAAGTDNGPGADVLAHCVSASDQKPAFQVIGDLSQFEGATLSMQSTPVALKDGAGQDAFDGDVTLTKTAPYVYTIYGQAKSAAAGEMAPMLYGWSVGSLLVIQETRPGTGIGQFDCTLNADLLKTP